MALVTLCCLAVVAAGCRRGPVLGKVHGQVAFQGQPLEAGIIGFSNRQSGVHMTANLDAQGHYMVSMAKGFGLPPGSYLVAIYPFIADLPIGSTARPVHHEFPNIPAPYRKPETSGLSIEVREGDNPFNVDLQP